MFWCLGSDNVLPQNIVDPPLEGTIRLRRTKGLTGAYSTQKPRKICQMVTGQTEFGAAVLKRELESMTTRTPGGLKLPAISGFSSRRSQIQNHRSAFPIEPETGAK